MDRIYAEAAEAFEARQARAAQQARVAEGVAVAPVPASRWVWLIGGGIAALALLGGGVWVSVREPSASGPPPEASTVVPAVPVPSVAVSAPPSVSVSALPSASPSATSKSASPPAPAGLPNPDGANLALRRPALASGVQEPFIASSAVDGDAGTRWGSAFTDTQWLRVDLGSLRRVSSVKLSWETSYAVAYAIQVSPDGRSWKSIYSTKAGKGGDVTLTGLDGTGRYVRVLCTERVTQYGYSLFEFGVF